MLFATATSIVCDAPIDTIEYWFVAKYTTPKRMVRECVAHLGAPFVPQVSGDTWAVNRTVGPEPIALWAVTTKTKGPFPARPPTTQLREPLVVHTTSPAAFVTVYPVIGLPPSVAGALHEIVARPEVTVATGCVGTPGVDGVVFVGGVDGGVDGGVEGGADKASVHTA
jgi:hypothetical protein